jgi:hypothetical protein
VGLDEGEPNADAAAMGITLDISRFPLVVTTIGTTLLADDLEPYLADFLTRAVRRGDPFVSIVDADVRARLAAWQKAHDAEGERTNRGIAIITDSALVRGAMTAVNWLHRPHVPTTYVATPEDAERWARARLADG